MLDEQLLYTGVGKDTFVELVSETAVVSVSVALRRTATYCEKRGQVLNESCNLRKQPAK